MENSKKLMKAAGIYPKLKLGVRKAVGSAKESVHSTGKHTVTMIEDKMSRARDRKTGNIVEVVRFILEENGVKKQYTAPVKHPETGDLHYLVQILSKVEKGETVTMEMKKQGPRNYIEVLRPDGSRIDADEDGDDVNTVDDDHGEISDEDVEEAFANLEDPHKDIQA